MKTRCRLALGAVLTLLGATGAVLAQAPQRDGRAHGIATKTAPDLAATDIAAARAVFERNLDAIRHRDRDAYLSCYLQSESLAKNGSAGLALGYADLAASVGSGWPDVFDAQDLKLVSLAPGVVYGAYRYRVRYGDVEQTGRSERVFRATPDGWRIAVTTAFGDPPGTPPPARALLGGTLVDGRGGPPVADSAVILSDGKVACAGTRAACPVPPGAESTEVKGAWITPGLVDAHVHFSQTGWADGRPDALDVRARHPYDAVVAGLRADPERFGRADLCSGVTGVLDAGGYPWTLGLEARFEPDTRVPHVAAAGPLLSTIDHWLNLPSERQFVLLHDEASARAGVSALAAAGARFVKVWYIVDKPEDVATFAPYVRAAGEAAHAAGLPLLVHATGLAEAKEALRAGARLLVHSVDDAPIDDEFLRLARAAQATYCPTLTVSSGYLKLFEALAAGRAPAIDDPNGCVDAATRARIAETASAGGAKPDGAGLERMRKGIATRAAVMAENLRRVRDAGIPIAMGTDAGNPLTLHGPSVYAEMEAMQAAGLTPAQVLVASTAAGAKVMGREQDLGTIEAGKQADLLVLDADPLADVRAFRRLRFVVRGGELRPIAELRAPVDVAKDPARP